MKKLLVSMFTAVLLLILSMTAFAADAPVPEVKSLGIGEMRVYDFGDIRLHAYKTNDPIDDESFLLETADAIIGIEAPPFYSNLAEYQQYIAALGKPMNALLLPFHPSGADVFDGAEIIGTAESQAAQAEGGAVKGLIDGFVEAFGEAFDGNIPEITSLVEPGSITVAGMDFVITPAADGFDIEIPAINAVFTHMMGSDVHNILVSAEQIDAMIAQMKGYQDKDYSLILTSHYEPETQDAVAAKIGYLETAKALAQSSAGGEAFMTAMREAFPEYSGVNYLEISAGALFQ